MSLSSSHGVNTSTNSSHQLPPSQVGPVRQHRKRKHSPNHNSTPLSRKQQKLSFPTVERHPEHLSSEADIMAQCPPNRSLSAPAGSNNHKISLNNHATKGGMVNHVKKPGQTKKIVIKNLKGTTNISHVFDYCAITSNDVFVMGGLVNIVHNYCSMKKNRHI